MREWDRLPVFMKNDQVRVYYDILFRHKSALRVKRAGDLFFSALLIILLMPLMLLIAALILADSRGPVIFVQSRITAYGKKFKIYKFRTMIQDAEKKGTMVTLDEDRRITRVGKILRKYRLDELPQLFNILEGSMTFVGTRPEVEKYVRGYTKEMRATLLLPAGVTSLASIKFRNESRMLENASDVDSMYMEEILPCKMKYNLEALREFSLLNEIKIVLMTFFAVIKN